MLFSATLQACGDSLNAEPPYFEKFMARSVSPHQFNPVSAAIEGFRQKANQRLVGGRIHGRGSDFDAKFIPNGIRAAEFAVNVDRVALRHLGGFLREEREEPADCCE